MKVCILADNRTLDSKRFRAEHSLAVLLQTADKQILLDTGASDAFIANTEQLGIDLSAVDYVFLSHGHADHTGGLSAFLQVNKKGESDRLSCGCQRLFLFQQRSLAQHHG